MTLFECTGMSTIAQHILAKSSSERSSSSLGILREEPNASSISGGQTYLKRRWEEAEFYLDNSYLHKIIDIWHWFRICDIVRLLSFPDFSYAIDPLLHFLRIFLRIRNRVHHAKRSLIFRALHQIFIFECYYCSVWLVQGGFVLEKRFIILTSLKV